MRMIVDNAIIEKASIDRQNAGMISKKKSAFLRWNVCEPSNLNAKPFFIEEAYERFHACVRRKIEAIFVDIVFVTIEKPSSGRTFG
jgi:hypothetical protein